MLISVYLSNALEFFDYTLFAALFSYISQDFFSNYSNTTLLGIMAVSLSLISRPVGSYLFGLLGDKRGRLLSLRLSLLLMTVSTFIVAVLPGAEYWGSVSIFILLVTRIIQGLSAGAEYNTAAIFAIEENPTSKWFISSLLTSSAFMGLFLALMFGALMTLDGVPAWFWRIGFLLGSLVGVTSFFLRTSSSTSQEIDQIQLKFKDIPQKIPKFLFVFFLGGHSSCIGYFVSVILLEKLEGIESIKTYSLFLSSVLILGVALFCPLIGKLCRTAKRAKNLFDMGLFSLSFLFPMVFMLIPLAGLLEIFVMLIVLSFFISAQVSLQHALYQELFPKSYRQRAISLPFTLGAGIIGSLTLFFTKNLVLGELTLTSFWFTFLSLSSIIFYKKIPSLFKSY